MNGDPKNDPQANIGRRFASPVKKGSDRATSAIERQQVKRNLEVKSSLIANSSVSGSNSSSSTSTELASTSAIVQLHANSY